MAAAWCLCMRTDYHAQLCLQVKASGNPFTSLEKAATGATSLASFVAGSGATKGSLAASLPAASQQLSLTDSQQVQPSEDELCWTMSESALFAHPVAQVLQAGHPALSATAHQHGPSAKDTDRQAADADTELIIKPAPTSRRLTAEFAAVRAPDSTHRSPAAQELSFQSAMWVQHDSTAASLTALFAADPSAAADSRRPVFTHNQAQPGAGLPSKPRFARSTSAPKTWPKLAAMTSFVRRRGMIPSHRPSLPLLRAPMPSQQQQDSLLQLSEPSSSAQQWVEQDVTAALIAAALAGKDNRDLEPLRQQPRPQLKPKTWDWSNVTTPSPASSIADAEEDWVAFSAEADEGGSPSDEIPDAPELLGAGSQGRIAHALGQAEFVALPAVMKTVGPLGVQQVQHWLTSLQSMLYQ